MIVCGHQFPKFSFVCFFACLFVSLLVCLFVFFHFGVTRSGVSAIIFDSGVHVGR